MLECENIWTINGAFIGDILTTTRMKGVDQLYIVWGPGPNGNECEYYQIKFVGYPCPACIHVCGAMLNNVHSSSRAQQCRNGIRPESQREH